MKLFNKVFEFFSDPYKSAREGADTEFAYIIWCLEHDRIPFKG